MSEPIDVWVVEQRPQGGDWTFRSAYAGKDYADADCAEKNAAWSPDREYRVRRYVVVDPPYQPKNWWNRDFA